MQVAYRPSVSARYRSGMFSSAKLMRQRVEGAGAETGNRQQDDQQAIAVGERQARRDDREHAAADQEDAPRAEQRAEVHGQRPDEHRGGVERGADPRALVDADAEVPSEIGEAQRQETRGQTSQFPRP